MANPYVDLYQFTFRNEIQPGRSNRPHWPGGASGLTIGPGYDIGGRTEAEVMKRFLGDALGETGEAAACFAAGAGLRALAAHSYLVDNREALDALVISEAQEEAISVALRRNTNVVTAGRG